MAETFYSVLGVDPEAETDRIKSAYRELVKTHHPDVSDNDDAVEQFKRITKARDVLTDESSRRRYDRVGHNTYVRRYMDGDAWTVDHNTGSATGQRNTSSTSTNASNRRNRGSTTGNGRTSSSTDSTGGQSGRSRSGSSSTTSGTNYERYRSQYTTDETMGSDQSGGPRQGRAWTEDIGDDDVSSSDDDFTAGANDFTWEKENSSTAGNGSASADRARADGWRANHASTGGYTPTGREPPSSSSQSSSGVVGFRSALRQIGPWLLFHFVFLVSAFVTILLLISWTASIPTVFLSLVLLGGAVFFSVLHMISRIYS